MEFCLEDCRVHLEAGVLTAENSRICRRFAVEPEGLVPMDTTDVRDNVTYRCVNGELPVIPSGFGPDEQPEICLEVDSSAGALRGVLSFREGDCAAEFHIFLVPKLPFCTVQRRFSGEWGFSGGEGNSEDVLDGAVLPAGHFDLETFQLFDKTDGTDCLIRSWKEPVYPRCKIRERGNLFLFTNRLTNRGLLLIKESPTHQNIVNQLGPDLASERGIVRLLGSGLPDGCEGENLLSYGSTIGVGDSTRIFSHYKRYYEAQWTSKQPCSFTMSNTWGDRHQDLAVCEEFVCKEIDAAAAIGVDIVQIDDGWQKGATINSALKKGGVWESYYAADPNFWAPNPEKFPRGLAPVAAYAAAKGVKLGLWFSPDSSRDFQNWKLDAAVLLDLYRRYKIASFKLDGVKLRTKAAERNYFALLDRLVTESGGAIGINQDITAEDRAGYLWQKQHGTLFVENRYTATGSYYPHNTLRNLWSLSRIFPARKFQFELLNNRLNAELYGDDPLAPSRYGADYGFATVLFANPLFWMELQHLTADDQAALSKIVRVYKQHREKLGCAEVLPLGRMPDGMAVTGFQADCGDGSGFLLLFREAMAPAEGFFPMRPIGEQAILEPLCTNLPDNAWSLNIEEDWLQLSLSEPASYLFLRYKKGKDAE